MRICVLPFPGGFLLISGSVIGQMDVVYTSKKVDIAAIPFNNYNPSFWGGNRFMAITGEKINIGINLATGKDDWG
ncbi:MAG: hypothetical protein K8R53_14050, partial [Bacteroidales bacterium]|nr:hypothetical protein [Bacteroidales bacterium]